MHQTNRLIFSMYALLCCFACWTYKNSLICFPFLLIRFDCICVTSIPKPVSSFICRRGRGTGLLWCPRCVRLCVRGLHGMPLCLLHLYDNNLRIFSQIDDDDFDAWWSCSMMATTDWNDGTVFFQFISSLFLSFFLSFVLIFIFCKQLNLLLALSCAAALTLTYLE